MGGYSTCGYQTGSQCGITASRRPPVHRASGPVLEREIRRPPALAQTTERGLAFFTGLAPLELAMSTASAVGRVWVGISGYNYPGWRGVFYPRELPARRWLEYASRQFNSIELNGTFYSLKSLAVFRRWAAETTPGGFTFAIKGSRFITHNLKLGRATTPLGNFYGSGILALGKKTGPFLWQLPPTWHFNPARVEEFLRLLPRDTADAARLARRHDARLKHGAVLTPVATMRYRHAF